MLQARLLESLERVRNLDVAMMPFEELVVDPKKKGCFKKWSFFVLIFSFSFLALAFNLIMAWNIEFSCVLPEIQIQSENVCSSNLALFMHPSPFDYISIHVNSF